MLALIQRWQTVVNLVHSMESNLSPRSSDRVATSDMTPRSINTNVTPSMTPRSITANGTPSMTPRSTRGASANASDLEPKPTKEHRDFPKGRLSALATSNQESVQDWYHLRSDLTLELRRLSNFKMLYHYPQISKPVPVQYCNKHWHEYLSGNRPGSVASNPDSRKYSTKSLPSYGGSRMNPYSPTPVRSVSVASRPFTPKAIPPYVPSRKSRSMTRSLNRSFRSLSPASSYGDLEHSRDSDVDDLIQQANNLHVPPPPPPPIDFNPDQFIAYKMPCMFRCQYCGQTQPVFLPESGVPVINTPSGGQNGMPDSHISPSSLPKGVTPQIPKLNYTDPNLGSPSKNDKPISVNTKPNIPNSSMDSKSNFLNSSLDPKNSFLNSSLDPKTNSFNSSKPGSFVPAPSCYNPSTNTDNPSAPVAYFSTYPSGNLSNPISDSFPVLKMPHGSIPPGSQILIIPPGGTPGSKSSSPLGFPTSKYSSNIPPDLQKIMDKYCPERNSDDDKPSRDQLVADAMNRLEEKKKRKQKEDYLNSLKDKRQQANNGKDKKKSRLPIDSDEELIADPNKQKQLHSSNPFGFDDFGTVAPNSKSLRELELAATAAAKWWEKTKKRLDEEKKTGKRAKSKSPVRGRSSSGKGKDKPLNQKSGTPGRKNPGSSDPITPSKAKPKSSSGPSFKGKSAIPGSDDECIAEFPNRGKLESALDGLDFLDEPVESNNKSQPFGIGKKNKPFGSKNDPLENTKNDPFGNKKDPSERNKNGPSGSNRDDPFANDRNVPFGNKGDNSAKTSPYTKVPRIDVPGDSSVENTPRPGNRPPIKPNPTESSRPRSSLGPKRNVVPTTPRDFTPRLDKVDKDSDVESIRSGYIKSDRSKSENDKPKNLDLLSIQRAADAGAKWLDNVNINPKPKRSLGDPRRPADSKAQPRINFPDDDEDEILTAVPTNSLFSAPPPLITKNPASTGSLLSDPESLDAPPSERSNLPLTSPESQNGPLSPPNLPLSRYPGISPYGPPDMAGTPGTPGAPNSSGGGIVNFGNVNMYIMQSDPSLNEQAMEQASKAPAIGGGASNAFQHNNPQQALPAIREKPHNPARPFQTFANNQFQDNSRRTPSRYPGY